MDDVTWHVRVSSESKDSSNVYVRRHRFEVGASLAFDPEHSRITALEYLLGALGADLAGTFRMVARRRRLPVDNVEVTLSGELNNPLTYLAVVGEKGHPGLDRVTGKVYASTNAPQEEVQRVWAETLARSPLVNTLKRAAQLDITLQVVP